MSRPVNCPRWGHRGAPGPGSAEEPRGCSGAVPEEGPDPFPLLPAAEIPQKVSSARVSLMPGGCRAGKRETSKGRAEHWAALGCGGREVERERGARGAREPFTPSSGAFQHPLEFPNSLLRLAGYPSASQPELELIPAAPRPHKIPINQKSPKTINPSALLPDLTISPPPFPALSGFFCSAEIQGNVGFSFPGAGGADSIPAEKDWGGKGIWSLEFSNLLCAPFSLCSSGSGGSPKTSEESLGGGKRRFYPEFV